MKVNNVARSGIAFVCIFAGVTTVCASILDLNVPVSLLAGAGSSLAISAAVFFSSKSCERSLKKQLKTPEIRRDKENKLVDIESPVLEAKHGDIQLFSNSRTMTKDSSKDNLLPNISI